MILARSSFALAVLGASLLGPAAAARWFGTAARFSGFDVLLARIQSSFWQARVHHG